MPMIVGSDILSVPDSANGEVQVLSRDSSNNIVLKSPSKKLTVPTDHTFDATTITMNGGPLKQVAGPNHRRKIAVVGDSYEGNNFNIVTPPGPGNFTVNGTITALNVLAGQCFEWDPVKGLWWGAGQGTPFILNNLAAILAYKPEFLFLSAGHNDLIAGLSIATVQANYITILTTLQQAGICPIMCLTPPQTTVQSGSMTITQLNRGVTHLNQWKRLYCAAHNIPVWDWHTPMVDSTSGAGAGQFAAGFVSSDNVHPNFRACYAAAVQGQKDLAAVLPPKTTALITSLADVYDATWAPTGNLVGLGKDNNNIGNGLFYNVSGGTNSLQGGVTGTFATGWTAIHQGSATGGTIAGSLVARSDGLGNWQQVAISGATASGTTTERVSLQQTINAGASTFQSGDVVEAWAEVSVLSSSPFYQWNLQLDDNNGAAVFQSVTGGRNASGQKNDYPGSAVGSPVAWSGIIKTPPMTISPYVGPGTQQLVLWLGPWWDGSGNNFAGTFQVGRVTLRKNFGPY